jgi:hypothetical protein
MYPHIQLYCNDGRVGKGQPAKYGDLDGIKNKIAATMLQIVFQSYRGGDYRAGIVAHSAYVIHHDNLFILQQQHPI